HSRKMKRTTPMKRHFLSTSLSFVSILVLGICLCGGAVGQEITGKITGQVTDPAGAIVNNAEVTLTNTATREERKATTDDSGSYALSLIPPGVYTLSVRVAGFKEYINQGLELSVNDRKTINVTLEPGNVSESITITGEAPLIQTSPTVGDVVE